MNDLKRNASSSFRRTMSSGQSRLVVVGAIVATLFAGIGLFHTASHLKGVEAGYQLSQVEGKYRELLRENEHLKMERATLKSAGRLESIARARLSMGPPTSAQLLAAGSNKRLPPPTAAPAAPKTHAAAGPLAARPTRVARNP